MAVVLRTDDLPAAERLEYWRAALADSLVAMDVRLGDPAYPNRLVTGRLGAVRVTEVDEGPADAVRARRHIRAAGVDDYQVFLPVRGLSTGAHNGREITLRPGDFGLSDLAQPFRCRYPARKAICVSFPRALLPMPARDAAAMVGARVPGHRGAGSLVSSMIRELPRHLAGLDSEGTGVDGARLGSTLVDLLGVVLADHLHRHRAVADARHRTLLPRIYAFIEEHLGDPELNPELVAAEHHVSLRYLHRLFEPRSETVAGRIRRRRLERCRRDLLDPALADRPVVAIARRHGFPDAAHFSRAFRGAYGLPPGEFRLVHRAGNGTTA